MTGKAPRRVYTQEVLGVFVRCTKKHALPGLFVIYKLLPPGPRAGHDHALLDLHLALRPEFAPPAEVPAVARYALAFSDRNGFLEPIDDGDDPWPRFYGIEKASPHQPKLTRGGTFSCYFVRHPDVAVARDLLAVLNGQAQAGPATPLAAEQRVELTLETLKGKKQLVMELDEDPRLYAPRGGDIYDGWALYRDMPHALCEPVQAAVKKLQAHLGALRYPVGRQEAPYAPKPVEQKPVTSPPKPDLYFIDPAVHSAILAFQTDHDARDVWKVTQRELCHGSTIDLTPPAFATKDLSADTSAGSSWRYLDAKPPPEAERATLTAVKPDAVVDRATAQAIAQWLDRGYRKAGTVLVDVDPHAGAKWHIWLRAPTAMRVVAWREFTEAMGCAYGLRSGHSYRDVLSGVSTKARGVMAMSLHKTGMAIDLGVHGSAGEVKGLTQEDYSKPVSEWPVLFERKLESRLGPAHKRGVEMHRVAWRLYGHSTVDGAALAAHGTGQDALLARLSAADEAAQAHYARRIGRGAIGEVADPAIVGVADAIRAKAAALFGELRQSYASFGGRFFRPTVQQWHYDPYDDEGGRAGGVVGPRDPVVLNYRDPTTRVTVPVNGRSFLNLTALGHAFGMLRISAQSSGWQDEATDDDDEAVYKDRQKIPFRGNFGYVVGSLGKLAESRHRDLPVAVVASHATVMFTLDELDLGFMERWATALQETRVKVDHAGATVSLRLTVPPADGPVRAFAARLANEFGHRRFRCTSGLDLVWGDFTLQLAPGEVMTGAAWKTRVEALLDQVAAARRKKQEADAATQPAQGRHRGTKASEPKREGDWTIELHPIFAESREELFGEAGDDLLLPGLATGRSLEWWHYQDCDANGRSWVSLMTDLGFARDALSNRSLPALYHRPGMGYPPPSGPKIDAKGRVLGKASSGWNTVGHGASTEAVENWPPQHDDSLYTPKSKTTPVEPSTRTGGSKPHGR